MIDKHHLLECILWPNGDGTFRKIINTKKRLKELGIYNQMKLTIPIDHRDHSILHTEFKKGTEYELSGERAPMYGKRGKLSPGYGKSPSEEIRRLKSVNSREEKSPRWVGDLVGPSGAFKRAKKRFKRGEITNEQFEIEKSKFNEYRRLKRLLK